MPRVSGQTMSSLERRQTAASRVIRARCGRLPTAARRTRLDLNAGTSCSTSIARGRPTPARTATGPIGWTCSIRRRRRMLGCRRNAASRCRPGSRCRRSRARAGCVPRIQSCTSACLWRCKMTRKVSVPFRLGSSCRRNFWSRFDTRRFTRSHRPNRIWRNSPASTAWPCSRCSLRAWWTFMPI
jgi:hypothetical protein